MEKGWLTKNLSSHHVLTMMIGGKLHLAPLDKGIHVCHSHPDMPSQY